MLKWPFRKIKDLILLFRLLRDVLRGYSKYRREKLTPPAAYQSLISLFCLTSGYSNAILHFFIKTRSAKIDTGGLPGIIRFPEGSSSKRIAQEVRKNGFAIIPDALSSEHINLLHNFALQAECDVFTLSEDQPVHKRAAFNPVKPEAIKYDLGMEMVINHPLIQQFFVDPMILNIARDYLDCLPKLDVTDMWWNTAYSTAPNAKAATMWHFDMDRVKWLKFFIYLTDVKTENGPHCFVSGSHSSRGIPGNLLKHGYARLQDEDIAAHYPPDKVIEFVAPRGTLIIEDTRGLHKGKPVLSGHRLIFQTQFSDSLFGGEYSKIYFKSYANETTKEFIQRHAQIYEAFLP